VEIACEEDLAVGDMSRVLVHKLTYHGRDGGEVRLPDCSP